MGGFLDRFDRLKKLQRENEVLELQVKNARLRKELREIGMSKTEEEEP